MHLQKQIACAWAGPVYSVLFGVGMLIAGMIPPPSPALSAEEIASFHREGKTSIQLAWLLIMGCQGLFILFASEISTQLRRIEGEHCTLANAQLALAVMVPALAIFPGILQMTIAFRVDEWPPQTIQLLNDLTFLPFIGAWFSVVPQWLIIGYLILKDKNPEPILPRWCGYANLWMATLSVASTGLFYFKSGPLAWNGIISFWAAAIPFFCWEMAMAWALIKAIRKQHSLPALA